jgi:hypothetical protein
MYAHYYAAQAMFQAGDKAFNPWYETLLGFLLASQNKDGSWSIDGRSHLSTGFAVLMIGIPYRYLPIYQR